MYGMFETHLTQHQRSPDAPEREYVVYRSARDRDATLVSRLLRLVRVTLEVRPGQNGATRQTGESGGHASVTPVGR